MTSTNDIRRSFLDYFGARRAPGRALGAAGAAQRSDLMFVNAGMVPFKNVFTGLETRPYSTAASSQKCVRAGGKHNDLDNVGYTARHHTFFEMLGNFSFGDYFKEQAIDPRLDLLTRSWGLAQGPADRHRLPHRRRGFDLWKKIAGLPESRIIRIPTKDNFWAMGDSGPCGPCSEIFFDHGDHIPGGPPGSRTRTATASSRSGTSSSCSTSRRTMRSSATCPSRRSTPAWAWSASPPCCRASTTITTPTRSGPDRRPARSSPAPRRTGERKASHRVIADHLRASGFLVADGVLPANEGRGYVLRRIMRRAMRHAHLLGAAEPLMHRLVPALVAEMGAPIRSWSAPSR
jgi:alanyl-tRNA synthetase